MRNLTRRAAVAAVAVLSGLGLAACGSSSPGSPAATTTSAAPTSRTLDLSFLQDPGTGAGDPDTYYAGQGIDGGWPDAAPPYMWAHISFDPNGGLNLSLIHISEPTRLGMSSYAVFCLK